ncbi:MAG: glycosyltransferase [Planctomycetota bacterium]|nr:glycosyltransferase [Planctomycetota bacterium]
MKLLVFSTLFPNRIEPHHGVFVKTRLERYLSRHGGSAAIVAPVPLAPPVGPRRWTRYRRIASEETVEGLAVEHPRFLSPPGFGDGWRASLMARGVKRSLLEHVKRTQPDVLDVHYAYPDGVAAWQLRDELSRALGRRLPMVLTCRGTDLNLIPQIDSVRPQLETMLKSVDHVICVADALREVALDLGAPAGRVTTLRNGVDLERFHPGSQQEARKQVGLPGDGKVVLCVGHLVERKGQHLLIEAFARAFGSSAEPHRLVLVGGGDVVPLAQLARRHGVEHLIQFVGPVAPEALPLWYRAADVQVLASSREGWPNVVLEGLACGTPIIATKVWGTPEILRDCTAGKLVEPTVEGLVRGLSDMNQLDAGAARLWADRFGWDPTLDGMHDVFERVVAEAVSA